MLENIFATPVEWSFVEDKKFINEVLSLYEESENKVFFTKDWMPNNENASFTYTKTEGNIIGDNLYLRSFIENKCQSYLENLEADFTKVSLIESWFAKQEPGQLVGVHDHRDLHNPQCVSGVFYVKTLNNPNQGQIILLSHNPYTGQFPSNIRGLNYNGEISYTPEQNKMLFFPSTIKHKVSLNNTQATRVALSYNLKIID
jgi:uncharacterized protein (TIGR02466 family)